MTYDEYLEMMVKIQSDVRQFELVQASFVEYERLEMFTTIITVVKAYEMYGERVFRMEKGDRIYDLGSCKYLVRIEDAGRA